MDKQRDFEKGWEEYKAKKKKAVEEIGQDIADICSDMALNCCGSTPCYACIAKRLERKGYRKTPENAVVLTREEYEWLTCCFGKFEEIMNDIKKSARKETAEKFAKLVEFHSVSTRDEEGREIFTISALGLKEILHEEFGIPYDEICKEISEGKV